MIPERFRRRITSGSSRTFGTDAYGDDIEPSYGAGTPIIIALIATNHRRRIPRLAAANSTVDQ